MAPTRSDHLDTAYPVEIRAAEEAAINERRAAVRDDRPPGAPIVGVALSGGGIRSATFCLGLFQALAKCGLVRRIDVLSTVSGGGYFGGFLGALFNRPGATADDVEAALKDNHSWPVSWLRDNGRFLSPNGSGDSWTAAAVAFRNWAALQTVLLTLIFLALCAGALVRAGLTVSPATSGPWMWVENLLWRHNVFGLWVSPWAALPVITFGVVMIPAGTTYWLTQFTWLMGCLRGVCRVFCRPLRNMTDLEFAAHAQAMLTRCFMIGMLSTIVLLAFAFIDTLGQTVYLRWAYFEFSIPKIWASFTVTGAALYGFGSKIYLLVERLLGGRKSRVAFSTIALGLAITWLLLVVVALSAVVCGIAWGWKIVWTPEAYRGMDRPATLAVATIIALAVSWFFSRCFGFVNLSSLQQVYSDRLRRAYIGASNEVRRDSNNYSMTDLVPGDDFALADYRPHVHGGPLHFVNVTLNETISSKTGVERLDRKGVAMSVGPCGISVGTGSHALWGDAPDAHSESDDSRPLTDMRQRCIRPVVAGDSPRYHALSGRVMDPADPPKAADRRTPASEVEALSIGRWVAISGAAFSTGIGAGTKVGLSLLLGLANVRLGYWWNSGVGHGFRKADAAFCLRDLLDRIITRVLPVQACLTNEFLGRFHGPARRYWYLSDGGHFENTACYELIRRRVPFIICSDAGQDPKYRFDDFATLVRMVRMDFGAEIEIVQRGDDTVKDDPGTEYRMPRLEDVVHPELLDVIGGPVHFPGLREDADECGTPPARAGCHAMLARIHYLDTHQFSWLLVIKPGLMGDESADILQYQATHPLFPQEPTTDQFFDEAQWESYRRLGEHIGTELFTRPEQRDARWSPSQFTPPEFPLPSDRAGECTI